MKGVEIVESLSFGKYSVKLSNTDKMFFPEEKITKGDLIEYYRKIAEVMLPYLKGRPVTMHRFPDGIRGEGFIQQEASDYFPDWISRVTVPKEKGEITHVTCENAATLVYLANQACITPHVWMSRKDKLHHPDLLMVDLDPPEDDFTPVKRAALSLRELLSELEMEAFVKSTGSRGLHVVAPLDRSADFDEVRTLAQGIARALAGREPDLVTIEQRKEKRKGRVYADVLRNSYGQTAVAPYSVRARPGAPVAAPLEWEELGESSLGPRRYNVKNIFRRLARKDDLWQGMWSKAASPRKAKKRLDAMLKED